MQNAKMVAFGPSFRRLSLGSAALVASLAAQPSLAQTGTAQSAGELETVTVTAQRRAERLEDVPITITNLSAERLARAGVSDLAGIATMTPALRFDYRTAYAQPTIRGVGTPLTVPGGGANVGIYVDGFYSPNPLAANFQLLNVESISVLKGPQGTLFGRNTTGGAIQVNTSKPKTDFRAIGEASFGSYDAQTYQGYVTGGLTDSVAVDISGVFSQGDGFVRNVATGRDAAYENWSVRAGLNFDITDDASVLLRYSRQDTSDPSTLAGNGYVLDGQPALRGAFVPGAIVTTRPGEVSYEEPLMFRQKSDVLQLTANLDFDSVTLTSYSQYRKDDSLLLYTNDYVSLPLLSIRLPVQDETITQEFLLTSQPGDRLQWTAGAFYYHYTDDFAPVAVSFSGAPFAFSSNSYSTSKSIAAYADVTYALRDNLFLTAGARYTHDEFDFSFELPAGRTTRPTISGSRVTPRAVIRYEPTLNSSLYASFARGYKGAIVTGFLIADPVSPESLKAYEVGWKYASGHTSVDLSSFYYDYENLQVSESRTINNLPQVVTTNAASSRIYGAEAQASYRFIDNFAVNAGAAWTHARYRDFENSPTVIPCFEESCGASRGLFLNGSTDASGFHMGRSPDVTANVGARYSVPAGRGRLELSANLYYTSKFYFDTSQQFFQDAYTLLSLRAEWTNPSGRVTVAAYGNNVTDEDYLVQVVPGAFGVGAMWGAPATIGASVRMSW